MGIKLNDKNINNFIKENAKDVINVLDNNNKAIKVYKYKREYKTINGEIKEYTQKVKVPIAPITNDNIITVNHDKDAQELIYYAKDRLKSVDKYISLLTDIEQTVKKILQYRGYNKKNYNNRLYRLEHADEITAKDKKLLKRAMSVQKNIAGKLANELDLILELYEIVEEERNKKEAEIKKIYGSV